MQAGGTPLTGGYGCADIPGAFGWAIRHFTRSRWDHAFVVLDAGEGVILEAWPSGSRIASLSEYEGLPLLWSRDTVPGASPARLTALARERFTGIPYGFADIAYLGCVLALHEHPEWLRDLVLGEKRQICSQLVAAFGMACGTDAWCCGQPDPQLVTPGMLGQRI